MSEDQTPPAEATSPGRREFANTDREVWRGPDEGAGDYYADSVHVTANGGIGINCGGHVIVRPARAWHALAHGGTDASPGRRGGAWQPIETAPKDGTNILLFASGRMTFGHWMTEEDCRILDGDCGGECRCPEYSWSDPFWYSEDGSFNEEHPPTHWQPLPPPPGSQEEGQDSIASLREAVDYAAMSGPDMLNALGDDASKWAAAFCQIAFTLGLVIDEGWMIGWFANAIEHSSLVREQRAASHRAELERAVSHLDAVLTEIARGDEDGHICFMGEEFDELEAVTRAREFIAKHKGESNG